MNHNLRGNEFGLSLKFLCGILGNGHVSSYSDARDSHCSHISQEKEQRVMVSICLSHLVDSTPDWSAYLSLGHHHCSLTDLPSPHFPLSFLLYTGPILSSV